MGGTGRALVLALAAGALVLGLLVVLEPLGKAGPPSPAIAVSGAPAATALQQRIAAARVALRDTEAALGKLGARPIAPAAATRAQYEAQIAAATERRDLARRHAEAIRSSLAAGATPASLAEIRDSVMIGQLLAQQVALDAQIATQAARLQANHPTMRALHAQRAALSAQIRQEAASIAAALDAEAGLDDSQIRLLEQQVPASVTASPAPDASVLARRAAAQRAELDSLVDAYFDIPPAPAASASPAAAPADALSALNLAVAGVAVAAAIVFQLLLAARRRRRLPAPVETDIAAWATDRDPDSLATETLEPLRQAW